jgi:diguanylate cyclase (GGDEF)-like protein
LYLDLRTLQVAAIVVCCVLGPLSLAFAPAQRDLQPSRYWGAALIALACGLALASLRGQGPDFIAQVLGPASLALGLTLAHMSARSVLGKGGRDVPGLALLGLFVLTLLALEKFSVDAGLHDLLVMGALALLACRVAFCLDRGKALPEGGPLRAIGAIFGTFGVALMMQGTLALLVPNFHSVQEVTDALMLVGLIAGLLLGTIVLMWVTTERINSSMRQLISLDPLTGALNRTAFIQHFAREASRTQRRSDAQFAILLIDIDHFRRVNDAHGHEAGDRLLQKTVEILRGITRNYDLIGRLEGDVFVLLKPGSPGDGAMSLGERARREIQLQASVRAGLKNRTSVSIGVAVFGEHGDSWNAMLRAADSALKQAKKLGGNGVKMAVAVQPGTGETSRADAGAAVSD